ncbi:Uncharacterised protein [Klebsiella pneumoniae]|nr:Uncharacterised protein [Klebsiella pneumoniae]
MVRVFAQRLQGADRHFIVVGGDGLDILTAGHPVADHIHCVIAGKFRGLLLDDFDVRVFRYHLFHPFGAVASGFIRQVAEQDRHIALTVHRFRQRFHLQTAGENGVRSHIGHLVGQLRLRTAVHKHQRDPGFGGLIHDRFHRVGIHRVDDNGVHPLADKVLYLLQLLGDIPFRVLDLRFNAIFFHLFLHRGTQDRQEVIVKQRHRDANGDIFCHNHRRQHAG